MDSLVEKINEEVEASGADVVILSTEGISHLPEEQIARLSSLCRFFDVHVYLVLRRHDEFLESHWAQLVKFEGLRGRISVSDFCKRELEALSGSYLDYPHLISLFDAFATVHVQSFDAVKAAGPGQAFTDMFGIKVSDVELEKNKSPSMNAIAHLATFDSKVPRTALRAVVQAYKDDVAKTALGSNLRKQVLEAVAEQRVLLEEKFDLTFSDKMPEEPDEPRDLPSPEALKSALDVLLVRRAVSLRNADRARRKQEKVKKAGKKGQKGRRKRTGEDVDA
jgi:hypothetical protein